MIVINKQPQSEVKKSSLLMSLERIESLVDMAFKMSVRQSVNGICLSIVSESAYAYRLVIDAAYRHLRFTFVGEDNDVDGEAWRIKLQSLAKKMRYMYDETPYNVDTLNPHTLVSLLESKTFSEIFKHHEPVFKVSIEDDVNRFGLDYLKRHEKECEYYNNFEPNFHKVEEAIEQETYNLIGTEICDSSSSSEETKNYIHNQMAVWKDVHISAYRAIWKVSSAVSVLAQNRDIRNIPGYMFEEYCQILINESNNEYVELIKNFDILLSKYSGSAKEVFLRKEITNSVDILSKNYDKETVDTLIDTDYIDNKSSEFRGFVLYGTHPAKIPVDRESLGRFIYGMFSEHKDEEARHLLKELCMLARKLQLLKELISPSASRMIWTDLAHAVFLDKTTYQGKEYSVNLDTIYSLCKTYLAEDIEGNSTDCRWLALALFAKQYNFLNYKQLKNGNVDFEASTFARLLQEWGFDVDATKISPYNYLVLNDEIKDYATTKLNTLPLSSNTLCTDKGLGNIQRFLDLLLVNCPKKDVLEITSLI